MRRSRAGHPDGRDRKKLISWENLVGCSLHSPLGGRPPIFLPVPRKFDHQTIDRSNQAADHLIAIRLRRDSRLLRTARRNLARWLERDGAAPRPVFREWAAIFDRLTREQIADFIASDTPKARRLRQSSPFMGLLTKAEREYIWRNHDEG